MNYTIKNEYLTVEISSRGAELQSIKTVDGCEYLWQGNPDIWRNRATNIFPYIARLTDGKFLFDGNEYEMRKHGFLCESELTAAPDGEDTIVFSLESNEQTQKCYPFIFKYSITYRLVKNQIQMVLGVENRDNKAMYFGIGGHPGFIVPMGGEGAFEDCFLEFDQESKPQIVGFTEACFVSGKDKEYPLRDGKYIDLNHEMFDKDAIILYDMPKKISIKSSKSVRAVVVEYPQMDYLGIWQAPGKDAEYVCIEPWSSLPSRDGIIEDLATQENLVSTKPGECYENQWSITIL